jgi:topoisomerase-4 subunit A
MNAKQSAGNPSNGNADDRIISLDGMFENYFLDYASYVILERAVPAIDDGLKPVQRRILHALFAMDDGRYHKVANIIGQTMQYHPHGDAAIGDALVNLGQKELLIDPQGNWGDTRTGDSAAAARYIEARLTKFALEVAFNPQTTRWQMSYDGRKREPIHLPMKFPLLLAQGGEGIAVGLATKILPHNFCELIEASIRLLQGQEVKIYPDFDTGGLVDVSDYEGGKRGGKVKVRARIEITDKKMLVIRDLPYGVTTGTLIESIVKANDRGKIKIKKIIDNTAQVVEIIIELQPGISPEVTMDALYAFTDCEVSISPNACVIIDNKPHFLTVEEILRFCTEHTRELLRLELEIKKSELQERWHFASLEKIFIEKRIYHQIEECESWEAVVETIDFELKKYVIGPREVVARSDKRLRLLRDVTTDDIVRLTEIKIKRISKYNSFKADELISDVEQQLLQVSHDLTHLTEFAITYYQNLLAKYSKGRERRTQIMELDTIQATQVAANNAKLYVNREEGFIGCGLKKDEFVCDCSDIDDIIVFRKDGKFMVSRIAEKVFVGKDILHVAVWKKSDERTTYNLIYLDGKSGRSMAKRFNVLGITRDKEYDLTAGTPHSRVLYFSANPNGEAELVTLSLSATSAAKIKVFDWGFSDLAIKGRSSQGNIVTKYPVRKIVLKEAGQSTIGARQIWLDEATGKLNTDGRGRSLGAFDTGDALLTLHRDGSYELSSADLAALRLDMHNLVDVCKFSPDAVVTAVHFDASRGWTMVKRFRVETSSMGQKFSFISEAKGSALLFASLDDHPRISYATKVKNHLTTHEVSLAEFIDVKGWKALGNRLSDQKVLNIKMMDARETGSQEESEVSLSENIPAADTSSAMPEVKNPADEKRNLPKGETKKKVAATPLEKSEPEEEKSKKTPAKSGKSPESAGKKAPRSKKPKDLPTKFKAGDTIEFDIDEHGQGKLF